MPKHRNLSLTKFLYSIDWDLLRRYFERLGPNDQPSPWAYLNSDALKEFLNAPENSQAASMILEEFRCINDICGEGMNHVVRAYNRFNIPFKEDGAAQELGMRLFLDHKEAFDFAWSRYLLYSTSSKLTFYYVDIQSLNIGEEEVTAFRNSLTDWYSGLAKGDSCEVAYFDDEGQHIFHVTRGSYLRTLLPTVAAGGPRRLSTSPFPMRAAWGTRQRCTPSIGACPDGTRSTCTTPGRWPS